MAGAAGLVVIAMIVGTETDGRLSLRDAAYVAIMVSMIAARYVDVRRYDGRTADGQRATMEHFRSYALTVLIASLAALGVAHAVAML